MKAYLMKVLVVDCENMGSDSVKLYIERAKHAQSPTVLSIQEADIGTWNDDHPLNSYKTMYDAAKTYFPE